MGTQKIRRGKVKQTSETAGVFSNRTRFNKAFLPLENTTKSEPDSESDAMLHPYSESNLK